MFTPAKDALKVNFGQVGTWLGDVANVLKLIQDGIGIGRAAAGKGFVPDFGS